MKAGDIVRRSTWPEGMYVIVSEVGELGIHGPSYLASDIYGDVGGMGYPKSGVYLFSHIPHQWKPDEHGNSCMYRNARMLRNDTRHL